MAAIPALPEEWCSEMESSISGIQEDIASIGAEWQQESANAFCTVWSRATETSLRRFRSVGLVPGTPAENADMLLDSDIRMVWDPSYEGIDTLIPSYALPASMGVSPDNSSTSSAEGAAEEADSNSSSASSTGIKTNIALTVLRIKPILIISGREFQHLALRRDYPDGSVAASAICADPLCVPFREPRAGYVTGELLKGSGWVLQPVALQPSEIPEAWLSLLPSSGSGSGSAAAEERLGGLPRTPEGLVLCTRMHYLIHTDLKGWIPNRVINSAAVKTFQDHFKNICSYYLRNKTKTS
jgi:hypothetical protein